MDEYNVKNPYVGIFPTRQQHAQVIKTFFDTYELKLTSNVKIKLTELINNPEDINWSDWLREMYDYPQKYKDFIYKEYYKIGKFERYRHYESYFSSLGDSVGNFKLFKHMTPKMWNDIKITPEIFDMGSMFIDEQVNKDINKDLDNYGISNFYMDNNKLEYRQQVGRQPSPWEGWSKYQLINALEESKIFETRVEETDIEFDQGSRHDWDPIQKLWVRKFYKRKIYKHIYPNLDRIGLPTTYYNGSQILGYDVLNLPKYKLENIYRRVMNPVLNWNTICQHPHIDGASINIEYQRYNNIKLYTNDKNIICNIINQPQKFKEIPELSQMILFQPPSETAAGIQYRKYITHQSLFADKEKMRYPERKISMGEYQQFYDICKDPTKDRFHALLYANKLGISLNLTENTTKEEICRAIYYYIDIIQRSKDL